MFTGYAKGDCWLTQCQHHLLLYLRTCYNPRLYSSNYTHLNVAIEQSCLTGYKIKDEYWLTKCQHQPRWKRCWLELQKSILSCLQSTRPHSRQSTWIMRGKYPACLYPMYYMGCLDGYMLGVKWYLDWLIIFIITVWNIKDSAHTLFIGKCQ